MSDCNAQGGAVGEDDGNEDGGCGEDVATFAEGHEGDCEENAAEDQEGGFDQEANAEGEAEQGGDECCRGSEETQKKRAGEEEEGGDELVWAYAGDLIKADLRGEKDGGGGDKGEG